MWPPAKSHRAASCVRGCPFGRFLDHNREPTRHVWVPSRSGVGSREEGQGWLARMKREPPPQGGLEVRAIIGLHRSGQPIHERLCVACEDARAERGQHHNEGTEGCEQQGAGAPGVRGARCG